MQTAVPALFAFMGSASSSVGLSAWRWACASSHCENRCFHIGQRKQIIRTHLLSETSSDYVGLVPVVGLEPTRCRHQRILSPSRLPIPSHRRIRSSANYYITKRGRAQEKRKIFCPPPVEKRKIYRKPLDKPKTFMVK